MPEIVDYSSISGRYNTLQCSFSDEINTSQNTKKFKYLHLAGPFNEIGLVGSFNSFNTELYQASVLGASNRLKAKRISNLTLLGHGNNFKVQDLSYSNFLGNQNSIKNAQDNTDFIKLEETTLIGNHNEITLNSNPSNSSGENQLFASNCIISFNKDTSSTYGARLYQNTLIGKSHSLYWTNSTNSDSFSGNTIIGSGIRIDLELPTSKAGSRIEENGIFVEWSNFTIKDAAQRNLYFVTSSNINSLNSYGNIISTSVGTIDNISLKYNLISGTQLEIKGADSRWTDLVESCILATDSYYEHKNNKSTDQNICIVGADAHIESPTNYRLDSMTFVGSAHYYGDEYEQKDISDTKLVLGLGSQSIIGRSSGIVNFPATITTTGQDYAEDWEWEDGNSNNEDRRGRFVTLDGDKIKLANSGDFVLGIVSANPSIIGGGDCMEWKDKYLKDVFGTIITEEVEEPVYEKRQVMIKESYTDTEGKYHQAEYEMQNVNTGEKKLIKKPVLNPDYDASIPYKTRARRPEHCYVGHLGKLVLVDDGTCIPNSFAAPLADGIATNSKEKTRARVLKRIDDTHVLVWWE